MGFWNRLEGWFLFSENSSEAVKLILKLPWETNMPDSEKWAFFTEAFSLELGSPPSFLSFLDTQFILS